MPHALLTGFTTVAAVSPKLYKEGLQPGISYNKPYQSMMEYCIVPCIEGLRVARRLQLVRLTHGSDYPMPHSLIISSLNRRLPPESNYTRTG